MCDSPILEYHNSQSRVTSEYFPSLSCMRLEGRLFVCSVCHYVVGKWRVCLPHHSTHDPAWCKKEQTSGFMSTTLRTLLSYHFHYLSTGLIKLNYSFLIRLHRNKQTLVYVRGLLSILSTRSTTWQLSCSDAACWACLQCQLHWFVSWLASCQE